MIIEGYLLSLGARNNVVEIILKKHEAVGLYLILEYLTAWIASHCQTN